ncbi:VirB4 family type IV secretion/conjugal transfer ATPase [Caulobacter flavus]|uniref:Type IV secretion system protein virB4 n=1 Tax=Caulobacter flavus TaxID=1679497 RepID=A0A2N5CNQ3_9CAUL|nr:VirB4 family type IV secretion/conjugal transfer ATPase [Caulobacter flavus]AYV49292.1 VirB4 family type IV secretion/conjugal transfer ATPase [Caulobacter flavus]PLR08292.1 VirB4 family type IV secretion/conjugal transfer ATPase [Caulobacter flavus]
MQQLPTVKPKASKEASAGKRLPYARLLDERTVETRDGLLMQVIHLAGLPFETADSETLNYRKAVRDVMLRGLASSRFAVYHHVVRREARVGTQGAFADGFSARLDAEWSERLAGRKLYVNDLFLTIVRRPLQGQGGLIDKALRLAKGPAQSAGQKAQDRRELDAARDGLVSALAPYGARVLSQYEGANGACSEPLEFLSCLYNGEMRPVLVPQGDAGEYLPYRRVSFGHETLELSRAGALARSFASIVSVKDYPAQTTPGMLDDLLRLPCEMVVTQSFGFVDRQPTLDRMNLALRRMRAADDDAVSVKADLIRAKDDVVSGRAAFGEHHLSVLVRGESLDGLDQSTAEVMSAFTEMGAIAVREDVNLEPAFWAQFPGAFKDIARRALISTANFAGFASGHNFPVGKALGNHWGPAVTLLETTSAGPYHFNFHKGDLGNFTIIGPSGSGKTVVLNFLLAQAQKYAPRTVFFDKDRGAEIFLRAIGGRYEVLRPGQATGFNPLALEDTPANRRFVADWAARLVAQPGESLTPDDLARIKDAVDANYDQAPKLRRLRCFAELFKGARRPDAADLFARLAPWHGAGEHAWLFDNADDGLDLSAATLGFDMTQLLDDPALRTPAMMYLFHRVEQRLDGHPTLIVVDEGWKALDDDVFVARIKDWEKTLRKRNGLVGFATQSAQDALESRIASAIVEQAATQIFMANPKAQAKDYCEGFGLTEHEFELVRSLPDTARCFLIKHGTDSVVARLNLSGSPELLTVLSGRESTVRKLDALRERLGDAPEAWMAKLLKEAA